MSAEATDERRSREHPPLARDLLGEFRAGKNVVFSSPTRTVAGSGVAARVATDGLRSGRGEVAAAFAHAREAGVNAPALIGALPFDAAGPGRLWIPRTIAIAGERAVEDHIPPAIAGRVLAREPDRDGFAGMVRTALAAIDRGELQKVVLARAAHLRTDEEIVIGDVLRALAGSDRHAFVFAVGDPEDNDAGAIGNAASHTLIGASPELLVRRRGRHVSTAPLAGSLPAEDQPGEESRAHQLELSEKDRREHAVVVADVEAVLGPLCRRLHVPAEPTLIRAGAVWHLSTPIDGELIDDSLSSLDIALALHPTPAVCGTPRAAATKMIADLEPFDRGLYAGVVGYMEASGDGEWAVTIRSGEVRGDQVRVCAGAGVVAGSDPATEVAETTAKLRTLMAALGIDRDL